MIIHTLIIAATNVRALKILRLMSNHLKGEVFPAVVSKTEDGGSEGREDKQQRGGGKERDGKRRGE